MIKSQPRKQEGIYPVHHLQRLGLRVPPPQSGGLLKARSPLPLPGPPLRQLPLECTPLSFGARWRPCQYATLPPRCRPSALVLGRGAGRLPPSHPLCNLRHAARTAAPATPGHPRSPLFGQLPLPLLLRLLVQRPRGRVGAQVRLEAGSGEAPRTSLAAPLKNLHGWEGTACDLERATPSFITCLAEVGIQQVVPGTST